MYFLKQIYHPEMICEICSCDTIKYHDFCNKLALFPYKYPKGILTAPKMGLTTQRKPLPFLYYL